MVLQNVDALIRPPPASVAALAFREASYGADRPISGRRPDRIPSRRTLFPSRRPSQQLGAVRAAISAPVLGTSAASINRAAKADRGALPRPAQAAARIATVEVVGLRDAAIVYRDRDGRELFRTDPVNNVTIVTKGLQLPEVTVRQHSSSAVKPVPIDVMSQEQARDRKPRAPRAPQGAGRLRAVVQSGCRAVACAPHRPLRRQPANALDGGLTQRQALSTRKRPARAGLFLRRGGWRYSRPSKTKISMMTRMVPTPPAG